ncbi:unnamed protein product [Prunus armeniaca]
MTVILPKIEGLLGMLTIRLNDDNFVKWSFQFQSVLQGYDLFDHFDGSSICPPKFVIDTELGVTTEVTNAYKSWTQTDKALLSLLIATLSDDAIEYVVGSKTSAEAWTHLQDRYAIVSRARVNHLKTEFHTMHKGVDSIEKYLLRIKTARDQLVAVGEPDLLFVYKLCHDNNCMVTFDDAGYCVQDKATRAVLLKGRSSKGLYHFPKSLPFTFVSSPTPFLGQKINHIMWHQRLGHPTNEVLVKMLHSSRIVCSPDSSSMCSACIGGKMSRLPFPTPPELQSLRVFGSAVFPYLRPYNDNKLQPRTCQCILLGYANGYKGVICYNRDSGRLCLSRHVVHDETVFPFKLMNSTHTSSSSRVPRSPMLLPVVLPVAPAPTTDSDNIPPQSSIPPSLHFSLQDSTSSATPPCPSTMLPVLTDAQLQSSLVQSVHPMTTRLKDGTISRKHYSNVAHYTQSVDHSFSGVTCIAHITDTSEPSHFRLAASQPHWQQAMQEEFDALTVQGTWVLVPPPPNRNILGSKWIYKVKKNPDGSVSRYKARLVAQGFS